MRVAILCHVLVLALIGSIASVARAQENTKLVSAGASRVPGEYIVVLDDASLPANHQQAEITAKLEEIAADHDVEPLKVWVEAGDEEDRTYAWLRECELDGFACVLRRDDGSRSD